MNCRQISKREREILNLVAFEYTTKEIASRLFISCNTVITHRRNLMDKLDVKNVAGMIRKGFELKLMEVA